jgi:hypothetical protein
MARCAFVLGRRNVRSSLSPENQGYSFSESLVWVGDITAIVVLETCELRVGVWAGWRATSAQVSRWR